MTKNSKRRSRSPSPSDLNLKKLFDATGYPMPLDVFARLNDTGVIVR